MGVNSLPKTVTRQRRDCDLNPSAPESSTLTTRLPSHPLTGLGVKLCIQMREEFEEDRTCSFGDMLAERQTNTHTQARSSQYSQWSSGSRARLRCERTHVRA